MRAVTIDSDLATLFTFTPRKPPITPIQGVATHRALCRGIMSAKAGSGISVMRPDLDASTSTEVDAHEAQWRAGVNRQARPDAASQE